MAMAFKRKNLLSRRTCSYFALLLVAASLVLFYYISEDSEEQSRRLVPDIHSDINILRRLDGVGLGQGRTDNFINTMISDVSPDGQCSGCINNRFILGLNYWEQLTMATFNLFQLVCLADSWNASVVQPFTLNSRLYGLKTFKADEKINSAQPAYDLSLIYDTTELNLLLRRHRLPPLTTFQKFLELATRQVIVIHYIPLNEAHEIKVMTSKNGSWIRSAMKSDSVVDCSSYLQGYKAQLARNLNRELQAASIAGTKFTIVKYVCVNASILTTPQELAAKVGIPSGGGTSVIVVNWRGTSKNPIITNSAKGAHPNKRILMAHVCRTGNISALTSKVLPYSPSVTKMANSYGNSIGLRTGQKFIAVHLRSEKIGLRETRFPNALQTCIKKLMAVRTRLVNAHPTMPVIDMTDFGPYSSDTCKTCWSAKMAWKMYEKSGIKLVQFDPAHFNATVDRGFASAVDMELLASASYLVLCGGGSFQNQAALRFLKNGKPNDRLIQVCTTDSSVGDLLHAH